MAKQAMKKGSKKGKLELPSEKPFYHVVLKILLGILVGYIHQLHVSSLLESDRHFSHLSTLEREMSFRTEMGLYYSYFKNIVEAPSFLSGVESLYNNNLTEYPDSINTLQRFNLYPEIILGGAFRIYSDLATSMKWETKACWKINRGENLSPVWSCEGIGDPAYFYLNGVWICAGMTTFFIFYLAAELSDSVIGGLFAVLCFFFNHGECTRVQWTPPLRESFAYPVCVAQMFLITYILKRKVLSSYFLVGMLSATTMAYMAFWQFAQFALFTQVCSLFPVYALGLMNKESFTIILGGQMGGLLLALALLFFNKMLLTSWLSCSLFASTAVIYSGEILAKVREIWSKGVFFMS